MNTTPKHPDPPDIAIRAALRVAQPDYDAWAESAARAGWWARPV